MRFPLKRVHILLLLLFVAAAGMAVFIGTGTDTDPATASPPSSVYPEPAGGEPVESIEGPSSHAPLISGSEQPPPSAKPAADGVGDLSDISIIAAVKNEAVLEKLLATIGIKRAMEMLLAESGGGAARDCHQEAHLIGRIGYRSEGEKAFGSCTADCHSGCYHGAMETFLNREGTANLAASIDRICATFPTSFGRFECLHGVGHGVLAYVDYDLPEAITECGKLSDSFSQTSCHGGMFMENILTGQGLGAGGPGVHATNWVNRTDPYFPCNKLGDAFDVQYQCYQMQTSWMLTLSGYDFKTVAQECVTVPRDDMRSVCFKSLGRDAAGHTLRNADKIVALCDYVPREADYYDQCVIGAVNVIVDFWGPGLKGQASELCVKISDAAGKEICYQTLAGRLPGIFAKQSDRQAVCATFEPAFISLCAGT